MIPRHPILAIACLLTLLCAPAVAQTTRPTPQPTRVTISLQDKTVDEALPELAKAAGSAMWIIDAGKRDQRITLQYTDAPLVEVLADFFRQAKLTPSIHQNSPAMGLQTQEALRYEPGSPLVLVILRSVQTQGTAQLNPEATRSKPLRYDYSINLLVVCDPAANIIGVGDRLLVDDLVYPNADFSPQGEGSMGISRVDLQPLSVFESSIRVNGDERIQRLDKVALRLRAWQAVERATARVDVADLYNGGTVKDDKLSVVIQPVADNGAMIFKLSGPALAGYQAHPWQAGLARAIRIDGATGPIGNIFSNLNSRGQPGEGPPSCEIQLGGIPQAGRSNSTIDDIDGVRFEIPTKVRIIDIPLELHNIDLP